MNILKKFCEQVTFGPIVGHAIDTVIKGGIEKVEHYRNVKTSCPRPGPPPPKPPPPLPRAKQPRRAAACAIVVSRWTQGGSISGTVERRLPLKIRCRGLKIAGLKSEVEYTPWKSSSKKRKIQDNASIAYCDPVPQAWDVEPAHADSTIQSKELPPPIGNERRGLEDEDGGEGSFTIVKFEAVRMVGGR